MPKTHPDLSESSGGSYVEFAQALRRISAKPEQDVPELFRRMVFNLVVGNSDDHIKNHGVLHQGHGFWCLSPAFDLVAQLGIHAGNQGLAILPGQNASRLAAARDAAPHFGFSPARADELIRHIADTVATEAHASVRASGGSVALAKRLGAFIAGQADRIAV